MIKEIINKHSKSQETVNKHYECGTGENKNV